MWPCTIHQKRNGLFTLQLLHSSPWSMLPSLLASPPHGIKTHIEKFCGHFDKCCYRRVSALWGTLCHSGYPGCSRCSALRWDLHWLPGWRCTSSSSSSSISSWLPNQNKQRSSVFGWNTVTYLGYLHCKPFQQLLNWLCCNCQCLPFCLHVNHVFGV